MTAEKDIIQRTKHEVIDELLYGLTKKYPREVMSWIQDNCESGDRDESTDDKFLIQWS